MTTAREHQGRRHDVIFDLSIYTIEADWSHVPACSAGDCYKSELDRYFESSRRYRSRTRRVNMSRMLRAVGTQVAIVIVLILAGLAIHIYRTQPRPARTFVERELHGGVLTKDETLQKVITVFRRRPSDYFRATRGILALTDRRLVYVGLAPRDVLGPEEALPVFETREFATDTMLALSPSRTLLGAARALVLERHGERTTFGIPDDEWEDARSIMSSIAARQTVQRGEAERIRRQRVAADSARRAPTWHVVVRGEALSTIATMYGTTPERLRELNSLVGDKIKIGQRLLVKPQN